MNSFRKGEDENIYVALSVISSENLKALKHHIYLAKP